MNHALVGSENRSSADTLSSVPGRYDTSPVDGGVPLPKHSSGKETDMPSSGDSNGIVDSRTKNGYRLEREDDFSGPEIDRSLWLPHHLPHWSSRTVSAARYRLTHHHRPPIEGDQPSWCAEFDGGTRVSSLQTGILAGPLGSAVGQHRFTAEAVVREAQQPRRLDTPQYGFFEIRARFPDEPRSMAAFWMIGYEDRPERSAEICVAEIFGGDVRASRQRPAWGRIRSGSAHHR